MGGPKNAGKGQVSARLVNDGGVLFLLATFVKQGSDQALQDKLVSGFTPGAELAAPSLSN